MKDTKTKSTAGSIYVDNTAKEKRTEKRYMVKGSALAVISPKHLMPYQLLDISKKGMAFTYIGREEWSDDLLELELFDQDDFFVDKLPIKIISDIPLNDDFITLRRCGIQFGELTPSQESQLDYFIQKNTSGES